MDIRFIPNQFQEFITTRNFQLGAQGYNVSEGTRILFDGSQAEVDGQRYPAPNLRGAVKLGWLVLAESYNPEAIPEAPSANIGVRSVLRELLALDYKVILLTNTSRKVINKASEKIPEINEFDLILTRDDIDRIKPDASGFIKALDIMGLHANEVLAIGDQASDIIAGKRAGVKTVAVLEKQMAHSKPQLQEQNPDFFLRDIRDLPALLRFLRDCIIEDIRTTIDLNEMPLDQYIEKYSKQTTP